MELNRHNLDGDQRPFLDFLKQGGDVGLLSDAGCPGVADPGSSVVRIAHREGIRVVPLVGPSSILLSIMASGFNSQDFAFHGYLPVDRIERQKRLRELEVVSGKTGQAQFFMETPYRNNELLRSALEVLQRDTRLFVGRDITGATEYLKSATVEQWSKAKLPELHKVPTVFGLQRD